MGNISKLVKFPCKENTSGQSPNLKVMKEQRNMVKRLDDETLLMQGHIVECRSSTDKALEQSPAGAGTNR
jgi:hypothetical protein